MVSSSVSCKGLWIDISEVVLSDHEKRRFMCLSSSSELARLWYQLSSARNITIHGKE